MAVELDFEGGAAEESGTVTLTSGQVARARFTAFGGSAALRMKITKGADISFVTVTDQEFWVGPAMNGDTVAIAFDGQGNPDSIVQGFLEAIDL